MQTQTTLNIPSIRIGNDLPISLDVELAIGGSKMTTENTDVTLLDPKGIVIPINWTVEDTKIVGTFPGSLQKRTGLYVVKIVLNKDVPAMATSDMRLFRLVAHSWEADATADVLSNIAITVTDMFSEIELEAIRKIISGGVISSSYETVDAGTLYLDESEEFYILPREICELVMAAWENKMLPVISATLHTYTTQIAAIVYKNEYNGRFICFCHSSGEDTPEYHAFGSLDVEGGRLYLSYEQPYIEDLDTIRSGAAAGSTAYQKPSSGIPSTDMSEAVRETLEKADTSLQPADKEDVIAQVRAEENARKDADSAIGSRIDTVESKIPAAASAQNQLADKDFVNSSIETASATFRGTYNLVTDLVLPVGATHEQVASALASKIATADKNDYTFVQIPVVDETPDVIASIDRYKNTGSTWAYEYTLNNSGFTAAQWAAINSGITEGDVAKLAALPTSAELNTLLNGKQDVIADLDTIRSGAAAGSTAYQKPSSGIPSTDMSEAVRETLEKADTSLQPADKEDVIAQVRAEENARKDADSAIGSRIDTVESKIPAAASAQNQLADKDFVNSSIETASATFRGTYNLVTGLGLTISATHEQVASALASKVVTADKNDYTFVQIPVADETPDVIASIDRYKNTGTAWAYEFTLNNSGFTAAQWAAINSGITEEAWLHTPEAVPNSESQQQFIDVYQSALAQLYQGITDAQNAKADYVGDDNYVYRWNAVAGRYERTSLYVKGDPGVTDYWQLNNKPTSLSQFQDDLGTNPAHTHSQYLTQQDIGGKADKTDLLSLVDGGSYNSTSKKIELKHGSTVLAEIDATAFIKDGMVSDVNIINGNLVITFNTDSGKEPISIPLTDIFNPANYYDKTAIDIQMGLKADKTELSNCETVVVGSGGTWPF